MKNLTLIIFGLLALFAGPAYSQGATNESLNDKAISWVKPEYPGIHFGPKDEEGYTVRVPGVVKISVTVGKKGDVVKAETVSGNKDLGVAAQKAAMLVKFAPARSQMTGILVYTFAEAAKNDANLKKCKSERFLICDEAANALYDFKSGLNALDPPTPFNTAVAEVDKLVADFDKTFEELRKGFAATGLELKANRLGNCLKYDKTGEQLKAIAKRLNQMTADKLPIYEKGRTEYQKRVALRKTITQPPGCVLFV